MKRLLTTRPNASHKPYMTGYQGVRKLNFASHVGLTKAGGIAKHLVAYQHATGLHFI